MYKLVIQGMSPSLFPFLYASFVKAPAGRALEEGDRLGGGGIDFPQKHGIFMKFLGVLILEKGQNMEIVIMEKLYYKFKTFRADITDRNFVC